MDGENRKSQVDVGHGARPMARESADDTSVASGNDGFRETETLGAPIEREARLKRLRIRCWRRGTKEMDLILGRFIDSEGVAMTDTEMDAFERLICEDDQKLYAWVSGASPAPAQHAELIGRLSPKV